MDTTTFYLLLGTTCVTGSQCPTDPRVRTEMHAWTQQPSRGLQETLCPPQCPLPFVSANCQLLAEIISRHCYRGVRSLDALLNTQLCRITSPSFLQILSVSAGGTHQTGDGCRLLSPGLAPTRHSRKPEGALGRTSWWLAVLVLISSVLPITGDPGSIIRPFAPDPRA